MFNLEIIIATHTSIPWTYSCIFKHLLLLLSYLTEKLPSTKIKKNLTHGLQCILVYPYLLISLLSSSLSYRFFPFINPCPSSSILKTHTDKSLSRTLIFLHVLPCFFRQKWLSAVFSFSHFSFTRLHFHMIPSLSGY